MTSPTTPPSVRVAVLGSVTVTVDGQAVDPRGRRSRELLARLVAARGAVVSVDRLVEDVWGADPPPTAVNSLQVHVSHLRRALEPMRVRGQAPRVLVSAAPGYAVRLPVDAVDLWRFEDLARRADALRADDHAGRAAMLARALSLWAGPAFAEFEDAAWAVGERSRLVQLRRAATEAAAAADLALGRTSRAVDALEVLLQEDGTREETARLLALSLYRSGRQADALTVLRQLRRRLSEDLGVDPQPTVRALEADILAHATALDAVPVPPLPPPAATVRGLAAFGRDRELAVVHEAAGAASAGHVRVVWIAGEAGDGKTTLVAEAAERLREAGWVPAWGRCPEVEGAPPGWAWREIAGDLGVDAQRWSDRSGPGPTTNPFTVAAEIGAVVAAAVTTAPRVLVVEDLHRADDLTVLLLRQVVETLRSVPVLVLVTYRASESTQALAAARAAVVGVTVDHLRLAGIDRAAVAAIARSVDLEPDEATLDLLLRRTGGNPLFVRELARLLLAQGRRAAARAVPLGVGDVLRARAARLPAASVTALRQAAVLGRDVDVEVLAAVTDQDVDELLDALEAPILAGLLHHVGGSRIRFDHAIVRDTFYADTPPLRRTRWHARAATVLAERTPDAVDVLAHHAVESLRPETAATTVQWTTQAGDRALAAGSPGQAAELYRQALRAASLVGRSVTETATLHAAAIRAHARAGDVVGGRTLLRAAVDGAAEDAAAMTTVLSAWDAPLIWSVREYGSVDTVLVGALDRRLATPLPDHVRARLLCARFLEIENADDTATLDDSAEALTLARGCDDTRLLCAALNVRAYAALGPDLFPERRALAEELVDVARRGGHRDYEAAGHWLVFLNHAGDGDLVSAQRAVDRAVDLAVGGQLWDLLGVLDTWRAVLHVLAGHTAEGLKQAAAIATRLAEGGSANAATMLLTARMVVGFARGDMSELVDDLAPFDTGSAGVLRVLALLDASRPAQAAALFDACPPVERGYYWLGLTTVRAHAATRLGRAEESRSLRAALLPWSGRIAGLDSGTLPMGPVDDALAACADLVGDTSCAARHRAAAADTRARLVGQLAAVGIPSA